MSRSSMRASLKAAAIRVASGNAHVKAVLSLSAMLLVCSPTGQVAVAADGHDFRAAGDHNFQFCDGSFALCAASTCNPNGKTITVNVTGGGTAQFPEADCTCPIFSGQAIADLAGGNMQGSCAPPPPPSQIWSLYSLSTHIPQAINGWVPTGPAALAPPFCPKKLHLGNQLVNCFSFACDSETFINGVPVATCHCPIGESLEGTPIPRPTGFLTQAGQGDHDFCAKHPVGGPISLP